MRESKYSQEVIAQVIAKLKEAGYKSVEFVEFMDYFQFHQSQRTECRVEFNRGQFILSTTASIYDMAEAESYLEQMQKCVKLMRELNAIIGQ